MQKSLNLFIIILFLLHLPRTQVLGWGESKKLKEKQALSKGPFRLYLKRDPRQLNPALVRGTASHYLFYNLYSSLYRYEGNVLKPYLGNHCIWKNALHLSCQLNPKLKWSNGKTITAKHYLQSYQNLFKTTNTKVRLLLHIKNAKAILQKKKKLSRLGITAKGFLLNFYLNQPDPELLYKLTYPSLAPQYSLKTPSIKQAHTLVTNGPYKIKKWTLNQKIILEPNPYFADNSKNQLPLVEVYFVEEDTTALLLYQSGRIDFLKQVLTSDISRFKNHKEFFQVPMMKFDYLGFSSTLKAYPNLRKALVYSLNYVELKKIYHALGQPGYPSLALSYFSKPVFYDINLKRAKKAFSKVPLKARNQQWTLAYSKSGGPDIKRGMEWLQNQWKKHLGLKIQLRAVEQGMYIQSLKLKSFPIFRKGIPLDRPTCLAAMETLTTGKINNYIQFSNSTYDKLVKQLENIVNKNISKRKKKQLQKQLCSKAMEVLLNNYVLIPLGEIHFSLMMKKQWKGWKLNGLNLLDLSRLRFVTK
ncbi:MAG: hypothetical protein HAW63_02635 [Bdellovibrionaceae bacterium]|nr:hypothetical protein [Pseudobdellovibrionaceae bacterium]